jgi:hypothetical protein
MMNVIVAVKEIIGWCASYVSLVVEWMVVGVVVVCLIKDFIWSPFI